MTLLILGLIVFLGLHSVRIFAEDWRSARIAQWGEMRWKGLHSLGSIIGFALIIWGYGLTRATPIDLWQPPIFTRHLAALLTLPAFMLLAAAYVPGTRIRARLGHPMVLSVKLWALAHLLANGRLADVLLFVFLDFGKTVGQPVNPALANIAAHYERMKARPSAAA